MPRKDKNVMPRSRVTHEYLASHGKYGPLYRKLSMTGDQIMMQPEHRALTEEERALLVWLIRNGDPDALSYAGQLSEITVVGMCTCGCPSIDLALRGAECRKTGPSHLLVDLDGKTREGIEVGVMLHARDGEISELEVYTIADVKGPFGLPTIESLTLQKPRLNQQDGG